MRIGLISDTHCPQRCVAYPVSLGSVFGGVDLILHAGDVGALWVLDALSELAPVVAVHGNDDTEEAWRELPFSTTVSLRGRRILLWHGHHRDVQIERASHKEDAWEPKLKRRVGIAQAAGAEIVVTGHTHIPLVWREGDVTCVNPGAIASGGAFFRQRIQTVAILSLNDNGAESVEHFNLCDGSSYDPAFEIDAGFAATSRRYQAPIVVPELLKQLRDTRDFDFEDEEAVKLCILSLSHECWSGGKEMISVNDVMTAIRSGLNVRAADRDLILGILDSGAAI